LGSQKAPRVGQLRLKIVGREARKMAQNAPAEGVECPLNYLDIVGILARFRPEL
jgi:hypothetical protein